MRQDLEQAFESAKKWGSLGQKWSTPEEIEPEIPADAVVHAVAYGVSENGSMKQSTVWVISTKGLHVFRRGMLKSNRSGEFLPIHLISGIAFAKSVLSGGKLSTSGPQSNEELIQVDTKTAENFSQKTKALLAGLSSGASINTAPSVPDMADQIRKLAGLLTDGLITQDEFDAKKAKLLDL
jgi:hypothetical protein